MRLSNTAIAGIFSAIALGGCASITGSDAQSITVTAVCDSSTVVRGAVCSVANDKGQWVVESPGTVVIQKSFGDLTISCHHFNASGSVILSSSSNANMWGNLLAGGFIGAIVDVDGGAGFNYQPLVTVKMTGQCN